MVIRVYPVIDNRVFDYCRMPYNENRKGCPNYGISEKCPPKAGRYDENYRIDSPIYAIIGNYNLEEHVEKMKLLHPDWSERQLRCVLYWQGSARKQLWNEANKWLDDHPEYEATQCPEGQGVNVIRTLSAVGVRLIFPPKKIVNLVVFAAIPKQKREAQACLWEMM